jgi:cephalosporin hydroxylase
MSLWAHFLQHQGRGVQKWASYFQAYERHIHRFAGRPVKLLEIGVNRGGSLQMWKSYLGPDATIVGIDITPSCREAEEPQVHVRIGSQVDELFLQSVIDEFGVFDVILDDGSHLSAHQIATMRYLYPRISPTGVYLVEDTNTSYVARYEGGYKRHGTFMEHCKDLVDGIQGHHLKNNPDPAFTETTMSMHIYDSLVAFEKGPHGRGVSIERGDHGPSRRA